MLLPAKWSSGELPASCLPGEDMSAIWGRAHLMQVATAMLATLSVCKHVSQGKACLLVEYPLHPRNVYGSRHQASNAHGKACKYNMQSEKKDGKLTTRPGLFAKASAGTLHRAAAPSPAQLDAKLGTTAWTNFDSWAAIWAWAAALGWFLQYLDGLAVPGARLSSCRQAGRQMGRVQRG